MGDDERKRLVELARGLPGTPVEHSLAIKGAETIPSEHIPELTE